MNDPSELDSAVEPRPAETDTAEAGPSVSPNQSANGGSSPLLIGIVLVIVFAVGLALGFFGRPQIIADVPVQVVVTVIPNENSQTAVQTGNPANDASTSNNDSADVAVSTAETTSGNSVEASENDPPAEGVEAPPTPTIMEFLLADARHFQGDDAAPVTIIEFSDFKWPYCGRFALDSLSRIREEYIDTGKVQFVYKHFAILGPESSRSAEASECAADQGKFWEYHDVIFSDQIESRSSLDQAQLTTLAEDIGLDAEAFQACLSSGKYSMQISRETQTVQSLGVRGTPGFLVNGLFISGAQPFEVFEQIIEEQLAAAE